MFQRSAKGMLTALALLAAQSCGQVQPASGDSGTGMNAASGRELSVMEGGYAPGTMACPTFACLHGATFYANHPLSFEESIGVPFEICRNDRCFTGELTSPTGTYAEFSIPTAEAVSTGEWSELARLALQRDQWDRLYIRLQWDTRDVDGLQDGDHYVVQVVARDGKSYVLLDERATYIHGSIGKPDAPCYQNCTSFMLDRRM